MQVERRAFPLEEQFLNRVTIAAPEFFVPIKMSVTDNAEINRHVSHLIDAYDMLPGRPELAFDATWKAFEASLELIPRPNGSKPSGTKGNLYRFADSGCARLMEVVLSYFLPSQACVFLYDRLMDDFGMFGNLRYPKHSPRARLVNEATTALNSEVTDLVKVLEARYGRLGTPSTDRKGAMFLRKCLHGDEMEIGEPRKLKLTTRARMHLTTSGLLYTLRNERIHGQSFSPFISSAATIKTYTPTHYAFIVAYASLHSTWLRLFPSDLSFSAVDLEENVQQNLARAVKIYGRHWSD